MQIDAIMDNGMDTGGAVDQLEFGMTVNLGEAGRVALAHTNVKDQTQTVTMMPTMQDWINTFQPNTPTTVGEEGTANIPYDPGTDGMREMFTVDHDDDADTPAVPVRMITVFLTGAQHADTGTPSVDANGALTAAGILLIERTGDRYHATGALAAECEVLAADGNDDSNCVPVTAFVAEETTFRRAPGSTGRSSDSTDSPRDFLRSGSRNRTDRSRGRR